MTFKQMNISEPVCRALLEKNYSTHFGNANGESTISELLLNFTRHHLPDQLRAIEETHNEVYEKRHLRLEERKAVILVQEQARQKAEKAAAAEAPVQVPEHEEVAA